MTSTASELIWIKQVLHDLKIIHEGPMKIFCDNQAVRHIGSNPVFHERTKHMEVACHFIRDKVQSKKIEILFVRSLDQMDDIFIKALNKNDFHDILVKLGSINLFGSN
jgi:hypothetical protein